MLNLVIFKVSKIVQEGLQVPAVEKHCSRVCVEGELESVIVHFSTPIFPLWKLIFILNSKGMLLRIQFHLKNQRLKLSKTIICHITSGRVGTEGGPVGLENTYKVLYII